MRTHEKEHQNTIYWAVPVHTLEEVLETSQNGLTDEEAKQRLLKYGGNTFEAKNVHTPLRIILSQIMNPLIGILLCAAAVTFYLNEHIETVAILIAVFINIIFGTYQEFKAENTIDKLKNYIKNKARVLRDGKITEIDAIELVPGDIVHISYGNRVPADARILESTNLTVDEAILTGESMAVTKSNIEVTSDIITDRKNSLFCGTYIVNGNATVLIVNTGDHTEIGKIANSVSGTKRAPTPVQHAVAQISWYILLITITIVLFVFFLGIYRGQSVSEMLVLSAAIAVGAVPEALPITLTVILSIGVLNISKKGGLIRKLSAAETLGSTTLILTDKTGTLTKAELTLGNIFLTDELLQKTLVEKSGFTHAQKELLQTAAYNTEATVEKVTDDTSNWIYSGSAFDTIILKSVHAQGLEEDKKNPYTLISPFNSTNKYSISSDSSQNIISGAPDILLRASTLSEDEQEHILEKIQTLSTEGKRLIAVGQKAKKHSDDSSIEGLHFLGLFTFSDPLRENISKSIHEIQAKGIAVKIITGDLPGTAKYIAHKVGIDVTDEEILNGEQIRKFTDDELSTVLPNIKLFVRVTPEDKLRIGTLYRKLGEIVAMTGDGVNDSPALKAMDIGISLASGSDVAKSAADMILLDNNFKTITDTITEGHKIRSNIQKVFVYLMSNSLDVVFVITGALITGLALPLNALQILWVNVITGTLPALAFAYDSNHSVNKNKKGESIFDYRIRFMAVGLGVFSSMLLFFLYSYLVHSIADAVIARSVFFVCFATYILTISYSFRNLDKMIYHYNPFSNVRLNIANGVALILIAYTIWSPFMQNIFDVHHIPLVYIWIIIAWNLFNLCVVEFTKWLFIRMR
ncbi:MAG: cation-transporting P-type ATPase [Patescibacteria group bacterium]